MLKRAWSVAEGLEIVFDGEQGLREEKRRIRVGVVRCAKWL